MKVKYIVEICLCAVVILFIVRDYNKRRHLATISLEDLRELYQNTWIKGAEAQTKPSRLSQTWSIDSAAFEQHLKLVFEQ